MDLRHCVDTHSRYQYIRARQRFVSVDCRTERAIAAGNQQTFPGRLRLPKGAQVLMKSRPCRVWHEPCRVDRLFPGGSIGIGKEMRG